MPEALAARVRAGEKETIAQQLTTALTTAYRKEIIKQAIVEYFKTIEIQP